MLVGARDVVSSVVHESLDPFARGGRHVDGCVKRLDDGRLAEHSQPLVERDGTVLRSSALAAQRASGRQDKVRKMVVEPSVRARIARGLGILAATAAVGWSLYVRGIRPEAAVRDGCAARDDAALVDELRAAGDPLTQVRNVEHFAYFAAERPARAFAEQGRLRGYVAIGVRELAAEELVLDGLPWVVRMTRAQSLEPFDAFQWETRALCQIAATRRGVYDGWATESVRIEEGEFFNERLDALALPRRAGSTHPSERPAWGLP